MTQTLRRLFSGTALIIAAGLYVYAYSQAPASTNSSNKFPEEIQKEQLIRNTKVIFTGTCSEQEATRDSIENLISQFYLDQFRHFQDPHAPYFMFMSKKADLAMGVGGLVRMRGWFDWNGSIPANGFSIYSIPIPKNPADIRRLAATPAGTGLFFTVLGHNKILGKYMAYIEGNFDGYQHIGFKVKKAYVTVGDWTAGYASSSFSDPAAEPITIDGAGPNGKMSRTNVLLRYLHTFKSNWSVGGSFEFPKSQPDIDDHFTSACSDYIPDICAIGQYQWDGGLSHVRLAALLRAIPYRDLMAKQNRTTIGWGIKASSMFKVIKPLTIYANATYGQGNASYSGDLSIGNYDLIADPDNSGHLYAPAALSLTWGAKYNFTPSLYAGVCLAEMRYLPRESPKNAEYKYGMYGAINLFWDITPRFQIGAEYLAGKRKNFDGSHGNANRIDAMFQLSF